MMVIFGRVSDYAGLQFQLVGVFGIRMISAASFFFLNVPNDFVATLTVVSLICSSYTEQLIIYSMFTKRLPGDIRGAMRGIFYSFGYLGQLLISQVSIYMVNDKYRLSSPLIAVTFLDMNVVFIACYMGLCGVFDLDQTVGEQQVVSNKVQPDANSVEMSKLRTVRTDRS